jgi:ribosome-binding protein aMBF1 (putative translation factor)
MTAKTCAACDCELDAKPIKVRIGGNTIEVCCESCARSLKEADASASGRKPGKED